MEIIFRNTAAKMFLDLADDDYLAARELYHLGLNQQFLWSSLQAIEKYIKSAILYWGENISDPTHDIYKLFNLLKIAVLKSGQSIQYTSTLENFLVYLSWSGTNRYGVKSIYQIGYEIFELDEAVWFIRRYCFNPRFNSKIDVRITKSILCKKMDKIHSEYFFDKRGESEIEGKIGKINLQSQYYETLSRYNFYFGSEKIFRNFPIRSTSKIAIQDQKNFSYWLNNTEISKEERKERHKIFEKIIFYPDKGILNIIESEKSKRRDACVLKKRKMNEKPERYESLIMVYPYIVNEKKKKYHKVPCSSVFDIAPKNKKFCRHKEDSFMSEIPQNNDCKGKIDFLLENISSLIKEYTASTDIRLCKNNTDFL